MGAQGHDTLTGMQGLDSRLSTPDSNSRRCSSARLVGGAWPKTRKSTGSLEYGTRVMSSGPFSSSPALIVLEVGRATDQRHGQ